MSQVFLPTNRSNIEQNILQLLNHSNLMNANTINSPRAVGDAVQEFLESNFSSAVPATLLEQFNANFARRSMADFAFIDVDGNYHVVDSKTHNLGTSFNMPNLTSVERLSRFYGDPKNYFDVLLIAYQINNTKLNFTSCYFVPIEHLDWSCLTLGALGWGQIQIANSNNVIINSNNTRKQWMLQLCDALDVFYPNEISKITTRIDHFKKIRDFWNNQPD